MPNENQMTVAGSAPRSAYPNVVKFITDHPWAIQPAKLEAIADVITRRLSGVRTYGNFRAMEDDDGIVRPQASSGPYYQRIGATALIPVMGTVAKRMNMFSEMSGGASIEKIGTDLRAALADPEIDQIVLQIDSPGGSVYGVQELADEIYNARATKRIIAIADDLAASAAYWIGSAAAEFVMTPSGEVGSIGVVAMHVDYSKALEADGISVSFIHAGENKVEGNAYEPLGDDARAFMQKRVDDYYSAFVKAVARNRGTSVSDVEKNFGQGRVFGSADAKKAGMVDRVATLTETMSRITARARSKAQTRAEADIAEAVLKAS
jgi:signal peptide peptidase SppA